MGLRSTYSRCRFWQKKPIFSDEAHFDLGDYVNKQNFRIWGTENPYACIEIWCEFSSRGIIDPFFFENKQGATVTGNGDRYRVILNEEEDIGNIWFQQNGATCHTAETILDVWRPLDIDIPEAIDALKDNIHTEIGKIQLHPIDKVLKNCTDRVDHCMASRLNEIIFHY